MRRRSALLSSPLVVCALTAGCGATAPEPREDAAADYAVDATFTIAMLADVGVYDPYRSAGAYVGIDKLAYDPLVHVRADGTFATGLAEEWSVTATSATFVLRPDVTCSDGTALTASQVAAALTYLGDPANASPHYGITIPATAFTATGDDASRTVRIATEESFGFFLHTFGQAPIMCARGVADPTILESGSDGTGPFVLTEVTPGQSYTFTRRDDYAWGPDGARTDAPGTPAEVVLRVVTNETTAANLLVSGEVNFARIVGEDRRRLDDLGLDVIETPNAGAWLWFNQIDGRITADPQIRRALAHAVDRDEVIKVHTGGTGSAATGLVSREPKACPGDTVAGQLPEYDVSASERLLDEAGWTMGADGVRVKDGRALTLDLHYSAQASPFERPAAELVARQWEFLGIEVNLKGDAGGELLQVLTETSNFDVFLLGAPYGLPSHAVTRLSGPVPPDGTNLFGLDNPEYAELVATASALTLPEACTYWNRAEQALYRAVDTLPISTNMEFHYLAGAQADVVGYDAPVPASIRVLD